MTLVRRSNFALPTVLVVGAAVGAIGIFSSIESTPTVNALAKQQGYTHVETLPEEDLRVKSRVRAWVGDCPVRIVLHKGNVRKFAVWFNGKDGQALMSVTNEMPKAYDVGQKLLHGKDGQARGVTKVTASQVYPPYLCDPRKPYQN